jgi:uncharacterized protein
MIEDLAGGGVQIAVRVIPRAATSGIAGTRAGALLVRLRTPPLDGAANRELIDVLADALAVPARAIAIVAGGRSRLKRVRVAGIDRAAAEARIASLGRA